MTLRRQIFGALLAATLATLAHPISAKATSIAPLSTEQVTDAATYIVRGTVQDVWTEIDDDGKLWTRARVAVSQTLKGPDSPDELTIDSLGGELGQARLEVPGSARYSVGEDLFVFLSEIDHGRRLTPVGMYYGKFTVRRAAGDIRPHAMRWQQASKQFDHRFLPYPAPENRLYLDDLVDQVEAHLDEGWDGQPIPGISAEKLQRINLPERRIRR